MPVDLDELFDAVRRQADTIPLPGAEPARQRGRHRDRVRAAVTVAVVVTLVAVGTGLVVRSGPFVRHDYPATPMIGHPVPVDGTPTDVQFATDGTRAYAAWVRAEDMTVWTATIDLATGAVLQAPQQIADSADLEKVVVTSFVTVVVTKPRVDPSAGFRLYFLDRRTGGSAGGRPIAQAEGGDFGEEDWVFAGDRILSMDPPSQVATQSVDGTDGRDLDGDYSHARLLGWGTAADPGTLTGSSAAFADPRAVLVTVDGTAHVIDSRTGKSLRTVQLGLVSGKQMAVFDGTLVMADPRDSPTGPSRLRFVDVSGGKAGKWETDPLPGAVAAMGACGSGRICVVTSGDGPKDQITAFDVRQRRVAWQAVTDFAGPAQLSTVDGRTLVTGTGGFDLYDSAGRPIAGESAVLSGAWLNSQQLLVVRADGTLTRRPFGAGQRETASRVSSGARGCTSTTTRLVCVTGTNLATWDVS